MGLGQFIGAFADAAAPAPIVVAPPSWRRRLRRWALRKAGRAVARIFRRAWSWGRALAPWYAALTVWLAAAIAGQVEGGWRTLVVLAVLGAAPLYRWLGLPAGRATKRRGRKPLEHRCWYAGFYALLCVWSAVGAAWTVLPPWAGVLWVGTFATWVRWMWHRRTRPAAKVHVDAWSQRWAKVKGMSGTTLASPVQLQDPTRWEADVDLSAADLLVRDVAAAAPYIAKAFGVPVENVVAEYGPSRLEDTARLCVVQENPCHDAVVYDESWIPMPADAAEGVVPFHLYPNGKRGKIRLWTPGAGCNLTLFSGDQRTGKSAGMEAAMTGAVFTGNVWPVAGDPQDGVSMPAWCGEDGRARWQAPCRNGDLEPLWHMWQGIRDGMHARQLLMRSWRWTDQFGDRRIGTSAWDLQIMPGFPAVGIACDELHMLMKDKEFAGLIKQCLKMMGKVGFFVFGATQNPSIEEFDNDQGIRQGFTAGNVLCYRNTTGTVKNMILPPGMPDPSGIPSDTPDGLHTKGMLIASSAAPRSSLPVYSRSVWAQRSTYWADRAMRHCPDLDEPTMAAFAPHMKLTQLALLGKTATADAAPPAVERDRIVVPDAKPERKGRAIDRIVAYLEGREGRRAHTGVIAQALDMPKGTVSTTLNRALPSGRVYQAREGIWALDAEPAASAADDEAA